MSTNGKPSDINKGSGARSSPGGKEHVNEGARAPQQPKPSKTPKR